MLETISTDVTANARIANLNGRAHLVAPMTLIVPGVLAGSMGPLLYPPDEVSRNPQVWNEVPMVLYHPQDESGKHISAKTPGVIDKHGLGVVKRSIWNGKHVAEGWFDLAKLDAIDKRLADEGKPTLRNRLENGEKIELSTGLFTENEERAGTFNGKPYTHVARNYRPDHLAILPDQPGACSVNDGCGVNNEWVTLPNGVHVELKDGEVIKGPSAAITKDQAKSKYFDNPHHKSLTEKFGKETADSVMEKLSGKKSSSRDDIAKELKKRGLIKDTVRSPYADSNIIKNQGDGFATNQGKHHETGQFLNKTGVSAKQIQKHAEKGGGLPKTPPTPEKESDKYKAFAATARQAGYTEMADAWEKMAADCAPPIENDKANDAHASARDSRRVSNEQIATNQGVDVMSKKLSDGERKGIIDQITANCGCNAEDQKVLNGMSDAGLLRLKANAFPKKKGEDEDDSYLEDNAGMGGKAEGSNADATGGGFGKQEGDDNKGVSAERKGVANRKQPQLSREDQEALSFARNQRDSAKRQYAAQIVANIADETQRTAVYNRLMTMPLEDLQFQASYFPKVQAPVKPREMPAPSFLGNAGGPDGTQQQTVNHQDEELLLDDPVVNYADWSAENRKNNGGHGKFTGTTLAS